MEKKKYIASYSFERISKLRPYLLQFERLSVGTAVTMNKKTSNYFYSNQKINCCIGLIKYKKSPNEIANLKASYQTTNALAAT